MGYRYWTYPRWHETLMALAVRAAIAILIVGVGVGGIFLIRTLQAGTVFAASPGPMGSVNSYSGVGSVNICWGSPTSDGGSEITHFEYRHRAGTSGSYGSWTDVSSPNDLVEYKLEVDGLTSNTRHYFQFRAVNADGNGPAKEISQYVPTLSSAAPPPPSNLRLRFVRGTSASLRFTRSSAVRHGDETEMLVWNSDASESTGRTMPSIFKPCSNGAWGVGGVYITGLASGTEYKVKGRQKRGDNHSAWGNELTFTTQGNIDHTASGAKPIPRGMTLASWEAPAGYPYTEVKANIELPTGHDLTTYNGYLIQVRYPTYLVGSNPAETYYWNDSSDGAEVMIYVPEEAGERVMLRVQGHTSGKGSSGSVSAWGPWSDFERNPSSKAVKTIFLTPQSTSIVAAWSAVSGVSHYEVRIGNGSWSNNGSSRQKTYSSLINGREYTISVRTDTNGTKSAARSAKVKAGVPTRNVTPDSYQSGPPVEEETVETPSPPATPTGLTVTAIDRGLTAQWDDPHDDSISGYQFRLRTANAHWRIWRTMTAANVRSHTRLLPGLTAGVTYEVEVRAVNEEGYGSAARASGTPLGSQPQTSVPSAPVGFDVQGMRGGLSLRWNAPAANESVTDYQFRLRTGNPGEWRAWRTFDANGTSRMLRGLTSGRLYDVELRAVNSSGYGLAASSSGTVK